MMMTIIMMTVMMVIRMTVMVVMLITTVRMRVIGDNDTKVAAEDKYGDDIVMKTIMTIITKLMTITRVVVMLIDEENSDMLSLSVLFSVSSPRRYLHDHMYNI